METVNLKTAITFRLMLHGKPAAFTTRTFRGQRAYRVNVPESKDLVKYAVYDIALDSESLPWLSLDPQVNVSVLWSNVLAVQAEEEETYADVLTKARAVKTVPSV
jgi:hypothetical protein